MKGKRIVRDVADLLAGIGLEKYVDTFVAHEIDFDALRELTEDDLREIGMPVGPRRKLYVTLETMRAAGDRFDADDPAIPASARAPTLGATNSAAVEPLLKAPREAERRQLTVMFVDLVGSSALASALDPEDMREVLRAYQSTVTSEITRVEGHVAKLMGDGVLAFFGWPRAHEDEAERAIHAGLAATRVVATLEDPRGGFLACRVGIATGLVMVGELIGEGAAREEAVVGETPNLAARLQEVAGPGEVVIARATRHLVGSRFVFDQLGARSLKGFPQPEDVFRVVEEKTAESRFAAHLEDTLAPMVGREEELALLQRAWRLAASGEGRAILVAGEPGIGKSRLVSALREVVTDCNATTLVYQCSPFHVDSPLWPFLQQLAFAAGFVPGEHADERRSKLAALLLRAEGGTEQTCALLGPLLGISNEADLFGDLPPAERRNRTLRALVAQLLGLAQHAPVLMIVEDAHWIDPTSFELVQRFVGAIGESRVLLLITARPEAEPALSAAPNLSRLPLTRLARSEAMALYAGIVAAHVLPEEVCREILAHSDGVPLYIEEVTKAVLETASVNGKTPVPATLRDSLIARLDRIPMMRAVAQIAACIGREFGHRLLESVSDLQPSDLASGLDALVKAELVFRRGVPPDANYTFKHALVRDVAYESLIKRRRQTLHAKIGNALEAASDGTANEEPELLAQHYSAAGEVARAVDNWLRAGRRAAERSANLEAVEHFKSGLELLRQNAGSEGRAERELSVLIALGPALCATLGWGAEEVNDTYGQALELARQAGRSTELFPALWGQWLGAHASGKAEFARTLLRQLFELAPDDDSSHLRLQAHHAAVSTFSTEGELAEGLRHVDAVMRLYRADVHTGQALLYGGHDPSVCAQCLAALNLLMQGEISQSRDMSRRSLAFAGTVGHAPSLAHAEWYRAELCHIRGEPIEAEARALTVLSIAAPLGMSHYVGWSTMVLGWSKAHRGEHDSALAHVNDGLATLKSTQNNYHLTHRLVLRADTLAVCGKTAEAIDAIDEAQEAGYRTGERWYEPEVLRKKAALLASNTRSGNQDYGIVARGSDGCGSQVRRSVVGSSSGSRPRPALRKAGRIVRSAGSARAASRPLGRESRHA